MWKPPRQAWKSTERQHRCAWGLEEVDKAAYARSAHGLGGAATLFDGAQHQECRCTACSQSQVRHTSRSLVAAKPLRPQVAVEIEKSLPEGFQKRINDPAFKGGPIAVSPFACALSASARSCAVQRSRP